jgi:hypothetical protein
MNIKSIADIANSNIVEFESVSHYGSVGGTWENKETSASFQVIIRYGDMVIVREG